MDQQNPKNCNVLFIFVYFPGVGPLLLSTQGGGIGMFSAIFLGGPMAAIQPVWRNGCNIASAIRMEQSWHVVASLVSSLVAEHLQPEMVGMATHGGIFFVYLFPHPGWIAARAHTG